MDKITLDRAVFKALASDTRLDILKALDVRQKTVTELAKELELNKATVFEHLEKLAEVGLIQKLEDDRKWVYWQLTWTGRRLLHPEKITLAILLSSALGTLLTAFAATWLWWKSNLAAAGGGVPDGRGGFDALGAPAEEGASKEGASSAGTTSAGGSPESAAAPRSVADEAPAEMDRVASSADAIHDPVYLAIAIVLAIAFLALVGYAVYYWRRRKAQDALAVAA